MTTTDKLYPVCIDKKSFRIDKIKFIFATLCKRFIKKGFIGYLTGVSSSIAERVMRADVKI